jgi:hypothetical protein
MKARTWLILLTGLVFSVSSKLEGAKNIVMPPRGKAIVLPNPNLMRCSAAELWRGNGSGTEAVYPVNLIMDHFSKEGCPQGIIALYDRTISQNDVRTALDQLYGKWAVTVDTRRLNVWRVEPEKFAIQLATIRDSIKEQGGPGEKGMKQVIYLAFPARAAH